MSDLDLRRRFVLRFVREQLPHRYKHVQKIFRHRGTYRRLKDSWPREVVLSDGVHSKLRRPSAQGVVPGE